MFEEFSSGYYLGRLYVEPYDGDRAMMSRDQHEQVNEQLYATGEGVERLDAPLVMKVDERHVAVHGQDGLPGDTLVLPAELLEDSRVRNPPALKEVLLAKSHRARQLLALAGGQPDPSVGI